jgi:UDPglucose 6-dehydrogenase
VIVTKSTVPVGTNRKVKQVVAKANPEAEFDVASNPEFLREGAAIDDFMRPDRVVVGVQTERAAEVMAESTARSSCAISRSSPPIWNPPR